MKNKKLEECIDTMKIVFYLGDNKEDSTLLIMRNKKIVKSFYGTEAEKLYKYLTK